MHSYFANIATKSCISLTEHFTAIRCVRIEKLQNMSRIALPCLPVLSVCMFVRNKRRMTECMELNNGRVTKCADTFQFWLKSGNLHRDLHELLRTYTYNTHKRSGDTGSVIAIACTATDTAMETKGRGGGTKIVTLRTVYTVLIEPDLPPRGTQPLKRNAPTLKSSTRFPNCIISLSHPILWGTIG